MTAAAPCLCDGGDRPICSSLYTPACRKFVNVISVRGMLEICDDWLRAVVKSATDCFVPTLGLESRPSKQLVNGYEIVRGLVYIQVCLCRTCVGVSLSAADASPSIIGRLVGLLAHVASSKQPSQVFSPAGGSSRAGLGDLVCAPPPPGISTQS